MIKTMPKIESITSKNYMNMSKLVSKAEKSLQCPWV